MNIIVQKLLVISIIGIAIISSYLWIYPLTRKVVDKGKLEDGMNFLESLGGAILLTASSGGSMVLETYVPGEIIIKGNYIELKLKTEYPLISQKIFLPLNTDVLPIEKRKISLVPNISKNCSYVNCTWCLDKNCNLADVRIGDFSNETFAIFWIYDKYGAICFTNDTLDDGYLEIDATKCYYEGERYKSYDIFLIDENGDYTILEDGEIKARVLFGENRVAIVGRTVGFKEYITELRLYIVDAVDRTGRINEINIICRKNCWKNGGYRKITTRLEKIIVENNTIKKFINIEIS